MKTAKWIVLGTFFSFCMTSSVFAQGGYFDETNPAYDQIAATYNTNQVTPVNAFYDDQILHITNEFDNVTPIPIGPFNIKATAQSQLDYDSNIFLTPNNKKRDLINIESPAIQLNMPWGLDQRNLAQLMYRADIGTFSDYKSQNYVNQYAAFNNDYKLSFGYINVQDDFEHTSDRAATEFTNEVWRTDNDASAILGIKFNKLTMETGYTDELRTYQSDLYTPDNHVEDLVSETALYQVSPRTQGLFEYEHGFITYENNSARNGNYDEELVGLRGYITPKTQGVFKLGYQDRNYSNSEGFSGFVAEVGTITKFTERTTLSLTYDEGAQESVYSNNNYYNMHYFYATLDQKLWTRWSLDFTSGISRNVYPEVDPTLFQKRQDSILVEGIGLKYNFNKWASATAGYTFTEDISTIGTQSYNDHLWTVGFQFKF